MAVKRAATNYPRVQVETRARLRAWLEQHHATAIGAWIVTFKRETGRPRVEAAAIAEEALCFGWVDSLPRALDAERSMLLVTPRKPKSAWSRINKERVARMTAAGKMKPAGLAAVQRAKASGAWSALDAVEDLVLPVDLEARFARAPRAARTNYDAFPRSTKRAILEWIGNAKKPEKRSRRIEETVTLAAKNQRANQWRP